MSSLDIIFPAGSTGFSDLFLNKLNMYFLLFSSYMESMSDFALADDFPYKHAFGYFSFYHTYDGPHGSRAAESFKEDVK